MPNAQRSQSGRIQPEQNDFLNYVELEAEFSHTVRYLDDDDTNSYLLPSEDSHLRSELITLAEKLVDLSRSAAFLKLASNQPAEQLVQMASAYLEVSEKPLENTSKDSSPFVENKSATVSAKNDFQDGSIALKASQALNFLDEILEMHPHVIENNLTHKFIVGMSQLAVRSMEKERKRKQRASQTDEQATIAREKSKLAMRELRAKAAKMGDVSPGQT